MVITSIVPCIKVTKEGNMSGFDMFIDLGESVKITDVNKNQYVGRVLCIERSENDNSFIVCTLLGSGKRFSISVNSIEDIEKVQ